MPQQRGEAFCSASALWQPTRRTLQVSQKHLTTALAKRTDSNLNFSLLHWGSHCSPVSIAARRRCLRRPMYLQPCATCLPRLQKT